MIELKQLSNGLQELNLCLLFFLFVVNLYPFLEEVIELRQIRLPKDNCLVFKEDTVNKLQYEVKVLRPFFI